MIIGTIQGSEGREWHSQRYQLVSELNARNNYLWIDGKQVKSDGKSSNSASKYPSLLEKLLSQFEGFCITINNFIIWLTDFACCDWSIPGP